MVKDESRKGWEVRRFSLVRNDRGSILILSMLVLMLGSVAVLFMMNTTTVETRIATNDKNYATVFCQADSGLGPGLTVLLETFGNRAVSTYPSLSWTAETQSAEPRNSTDTSTNNLISEVLGSGPNTSGSGFMIDQPAMAGMATTVLIKRPAGAASTNSTGGSAEFGSAHEGAGYGATGGVSISYLLNSSSSGPSNAAVAVQAKYKKVINVGGGS
jgi:Tfp pilus assembly protein PilX